MHSSWLCLRRRGGAQEGAAYLALCPVPATRCTTCAGCLKIKVPRGWGNPCLQKQALSDKGWGGGSSGGRGGGSGSDGGSIRSAAAACRPASVIQPTRSRSVWLRALSEAAVCCEQADLCWLPGGNERFHLACRSEPYVNSLVKMYVRRPYCCHELFGFDIMLDENLKPWILEVNISPR